MLHSLHVLHTPALHANQFAACSGVTPTNRLRATELANRNARISFRPSASRGREAAALSSTLQVPCSTTTRQTVYQHLDIESRISIQISSAQSLGELNAILLTGNYADSMTHSHVSAVVEAMPHTLASTTIGQTERLIVQRMLKQLNALASMYLHRFEPAEITALLGGWARLQALDPRLQSSDPVLTSLLLDLLFTEMECLSLPQLVSSTWAMGHLDVTLTPCQERRLLSMLQQSMVRFDEEDHVEVAEGLAGLGVTIPKMWSYEWQIRTVGLPYLTPHHATILLKSAAAIRIFDQGMSPEWVDAMLAKASGGLSALGPTIVADTFTAVATLASPASVRPNWSDDLLSAAAQTMFTRPAINGGIKPLSLSSMGESPVLAAVSADDLAKVAAAIGALGIQPMGVWVSQFLKTVGYKLPSFEAAHVAALVWGLAKMGYQPESEFLLQLKGEIECRLQEFDATQATKVAWALGVFSMGQLQQQQKQI